MRTRPPRLRATATSTESAAEDRYRHEGGARSAPPFVLPGAPRNWG